MTKQRKKSPHCLNCNHPLTETDNFCPQCGQENSDRKIPLIHLIKDFLGDYFTFDSKLFRSVIPLLFKPGFLTIEFNSGRRVKYIPPLRMYIFVSFIYFLLLSAESPFKAEIQSEADGTANEKKEKTDTFTLSTKKGEFLLSKDEISNLTDEKKLMALMSKIQIQSTAFNRFAVKLLAKQAIKLMEKNENYFDYLKKNISIMMFFFLPAFAIVLKLLYFRSRLYYMEHLVFIFHYHSFLFLFFTLIKLLGFVMPEFSVGLVAIVFFLAVAWIFKYLIKAMRAVYRQSMTNTVIKFLILLAGYLFTSILFITATLLISFLLF